MFTAENFYCPSNAELREIAPCILSDWHTEHIAEYLYIEIFRNVSEAFSYENTVVEQKRNISATIRCSPFRYFPL